MQVSTLSTSYSLVLSMKAGGIPSNTTTTVAARLPLPLSTCSVPSNTTAAVLIEPRIRPVRTLANARLASLCA